MTPMNYAIYWRYHLRYCWSGLTTNLMNIMTDFVRNWKMTKPTHVKVLTDNAHGTDLVAGEVLPIDDWTAGGDECECGGWCFDFPGDEMEYTFVYYSEDNNPKARAGALKVPTQFVPPVAKLHLGLAMKDGAEKYGPFNWRIEPVSSTTYMGAMERHLAAWFDGEDKAEDSGCHHLAHVMACCALILDSEDLGVLVDDRPPKGPSSAFLKEYLESQEENQE
jgi:hypothetical protein